MKLEKAKMEFIQTWGTLGSAWGIPRSMAQIHALLLTSGEALSTEEVMQAIQLSRGNVNINLRELINWGLISKQNKLGERREFFMAEHRIWGIAKQVIRERKKRELQPVQNLLRQLKSKELEGDPEAVEHFTNFLNELDEFLNQMDQLSELMIKMKDNIFFKQMIRLLS